MILAIQKFENIMVNSEGVKLLVALLQVFFATFILTSMLAILNKFTINRRGGYKLISFFIEGLVILVKGVVSFAAIAYVFFYDYENKCFDINHLSKITQISAASYFVGVLAIAEIASIFKSFYDKLASYPNFSDKDFSDDEE